ncbi:adenylyltransferase/cytidyltransferase family protein [Candidatus Parcubacteria bacterium]|nr:adenylyltransferase/cytidyltransferase family protein [Candidatus Parcubacteria bacterium]
MGVASSSKVVPFSKVTDLRRRLRSQGKRIVVCLGAFDLIHAGHASFLAEARAEGDILVVGLEGNKLRRSLKGAAHPMVDEKVRAETLAYFRAVNFVTVVGEGDLLEFFKALRPDIFYTTKAAWEELGGRVGKSALRKSIKRVVRVPKSKSYLSSSALIEKVADLKIKRLLESFSAELRVDLRLNSDISKPFKASENVLDFSDQVPRNLLSLIFKGEEVPLGKLGWLKSRLRGRRVVFTAGTFDLFHIGHARFLEKARSLGDILVVGVPSNASVRRLKGAGKPLIDEKTRAALLCYLDSVDYVTIFSQDTVAAALKKLQPDIFFTVREDWNKDFKASPEYQIVTDYGGKVVVEPRQAPFISGTSIIERAAGLRVKKVFRECLGKAESTNIFSEARLAKNWYENLCKGLTKCPLCDLRKKYIISEGQTMVLTANLYPYTDGHLMIVPRRHIEHFSELTSEEWSEARDLFTKAQRLLKEELGLESVWLLLREGNKSGKSVGHLHFHVMPYEKGLLEWNYQEIGLPPEELAERLRKFLSGVG